MSQSAVSAGMKRMLWTLDELISLWSVPYPNGCVVWYGALERGVPVIRYQGATISVRRYLYEQLYGSIDGDHKQVRSGWECRAYIGRLCVEPIHAVIYKESTAQTRYRERHRYCKICRTKIEEVKPQQGLSGQLYVRAVRTVRGKFGAYRQEVKRKLVRTTTPFRVGLCPKHLALSETEFATQSPKRFVKSPKPRRWIEP